MLGGNVTGPVPDDVSVDLSEKCAMKGRRVGRFVVPSTHSLYCSAAAQLRVRRMVGRRVFVLSGDVTLLWPGEDSPVVRKSNPICMKDIRFHL